MVDEAPSALVRDLLDFVGHEGRPLSDVLDAWRTSCPRLPVWETALDGGLVAVVPGEDRVSMVQLTTRGADRLALSRV